MRELEFWWTCQWVTGAKTWDATASTKILKNIQLWDQEFVIPGPLTTGATDTNCYSASFTATRAGGSPAMAICGTNSGHHMILQAHTQCNSLGEWGKGSKKYAKKIWVVNRIYIFFWKPHNNGPEAENKMVQTSLWRRWTGLGINTRVENSILFFLNPSISIT